MDEAADRLEEILASLSGWVVFAIGLVFYPVLGLLLPLALRLSILQLVFFNVAGVVLAGVVSLGWLAGKVEAARRRHLVEWTTDLRLLKADEFEWLVGEVFRREGWSVRETGQQDQSDGNIDLELTGRGKRLIVQCKRWQSWLVDVDEIRVFGGTLLREGLQGANGVFVTLSDFTESAKREADQLGIELIGGPSLYRRVEKVRKPQTCSICGNAMVLDRSARGWWFRCVKPGCSGKFDLGSDPGRAVALLTQ